MSEFVDDMLFLDDILSLKKEIKELKKGISKLKEERENFSKACKRFIQQAEEKMILSIRKSIKEMEKCNASMDRQREFLQGVKDTNENVEESLCNVLLAIRQNEYLQAWYPAQKGHPEMKVVGVHPANIPTEKEEKNVS